jgi:hypothetical protein
VTTIVLQVGLPLILIAWAAAWPQSNAIGRLLHFAAAGAFILAIFLVTAWSFPPWWVPWLIGVLWTVAALLTPWRGKREPGPASGKLEWFSIVFVIVLFLAGITVVSIAISSRTPPPETVDVASPLGKGNFIVVNGGINLLTNAHVRTLDAAVPAYARWRAQSFGVDIVAVNDFGFHARGLWPKNPELYEIFGAEVFAPCSGIVVSVENSFPDLDVPEVDLANKAGNHVVLDCGTYYILLAHFRHGSVKVATGQHISTGDSIGQVGNSGSSSEPHLHLHAQKPGMPSAPFAAEPLPLSINGRFLVRNDFL